MIDHIYGKPSPTWKRAQVFLVISFWVWRLSIGDGRGGGSAAATAGGARKPLRLRSRGGILGIVGWVNRNLGRFSPYQLLVGTLTLVYAVRNLDVILGLQAPEPLARMYSRAYYRASYLAVAFDAGFATAMPVRPKWLRDICSMLFSGYYLIWAQEADEKLRRYRAVCTVEMLRTTWQKTLNPYLRALTYFDRPRLPLVRKILLPRPKSSKHTKPISAMLFFARPAAELATCSELILDFPGGGFIAMGPDCHEERLRRWAKRTGKPVLSVDYGKAPEFPYPWAIEEGYDVYRLLCETKGAVIGMQSGECPSIILTGDSAGGNICTTIMLHILEQKETAASSSSKPLPHPVALVLAYPALDFNFTSWMTPEHLQVLRTEQSTSNIPGLEHGKDHMSHKSPLAVVDDNDDDDGPAGRGSGAMNRISTWKRSLSSRFRRTASTSSGSLEEDQGGAADFPEERKRLQDRVKTPFEEKSMETMQAELQRAVNSAERHAASKKTKATPIGTRLTMTSRTGYFQDRIISPSMMRAMAILYVGPKHNPDFKSDYYLSPILAPEHLLAKFPRLYLICGEKDPFVDDTVILAGRVREAKRRRLMEAKRKQTVQIGKVRESLRMSAARHSIPLAEDPILYEEEEDWIHMRIIEKWSHGFLNMVGIVLPEAEGMVLDMADWMDETFARSATQRTKSSTPFTLVKPARAYHPSPANKTLGSADLGGAPLNDDEDDEEVLSFSTRKSGGGGGGSGAGWEVPSLQPANVSRNSSAPQFDAPPEVELSARNGQLVDSIRQAMSPQRVPKSQFAFFTPNKTSESPRLAPSTDSPGLTAIGPSRFTNMTPRRDTSPTPSDTSAAAARASKLLQGALTEAELMRRRRMEAVYGISESQRKHDDDGDDDDGDEVVKGSPGFRWGG